MPRHLIGDLPFPPLVFFDEDRSIEAADILAIAADRTAGASICLRYPQGSDKRGGYFFHFEPTRSNQDFSVYDFEKRLVKVFTLQELVAFINHCTGRVFDERSFVLCQTELNFLKDEEPNA